VPAMWKELKETLTTIHCTAKLAKELYAKRRCMKQKNLEFVKKACILVVEAISVIALYGAKT
jgi:hypothetical protein